MSDKLGVEIKHPRCMFCGEDQKLLNLVRQFQLYCFHCDASGPICDTELEAITKYKNASHPEDQ